MKIFSRCFLMVVFPPAENPLPLYVAVRNSNMDSAKIKMRIKGNREPGFASGPSAKPWKGVGRMFDLRDAFAVGMTEETSKTVEASDTVGNFSPNLNEFLSTSACVNTMIRMAIDMIDRFLPEGMISVGRKVEISHTAPSLLGVHVHYRIVLTGIDENHLHFTFVGWDGLGEICHGRHERVVVSREALVRKAQERAGFLTEA